MSRIEKLITELRNIINKPRKQTELLRDKISWNKLCACLDTIGDNELAIQEYKDSNPSYLVLYGLLQALFLQQDAVNNLSVALLKKEINFKKDYFDLYNIREIRNDTTGHPTNRRNNTSFHVINRSSIAKDFFQVVDYLPEEKINFREINIKNCLEIQEKFISKILIEIKITLEKEEKEHKKKFKDKKLIDLVPNTLNYHITKIYEGCYTNYPIVEIDFSYVLEVYEKIKEAIIDRYGELEALIGVQESVRKLDFIFHRLSKYLEDGNYFGSTDFEIYVDSLKREFDDLIEMLKEIDEDFSSF